MRQGTTSTPAPAAMTNSPLLGGRSFPSFSRVPPEDEQCFAVSALFYGLLNGSHFILCAAHAYRAAAAEEPCEQGVDLEQFLLGEHDHPPAPPGDHDEHRVDGGDMGGRKDAAFGLHLFQVFAPLYMDAETDMPQKPRKGH